MSEISPALLRDYVTTITVLDSIRDAVLFLNPSGKIEYANNSALKLLKIELNDMLGKAVDDFLIDYASEPADRIFRKAKQAFSNQETLDKLNAGLLGDLEAALVYRSVVVPVSLCFNAITDDQEKIRYIVATARDISNRQTLEKELRLQQAMSVSHDRLRALGELAVGLVHELTQPLLALKLRVEMLSEKDELKTEPFQETVPEMLGLVDRMTSTIQTIRSFASQAEDQTISMININECLDKALSLVNYEFVKRNISVEINKGSNLPYFVGNSLLVQQVFVNILTNARDAFDMPVTDDENVDEKPEIVLETRSHEGKWLEISFKDNAGGIEPHNVNRVFEPFFTTRRPDQNSGVGLSFAKSIITSLGGDIRLKVDEGKGSTFTVRIPVVLEEESDQLRNLIEMLS